MSNLEFKKQMKTEFIPAIEEMIVKEKEHLKLLKKHGASILINNSESMIFYMQNRLFDYKKYCDS